MTSLLRNRVHAPDGDDVLDVDESAARKAHEPSRLVSAARQRTAWAFALLALLLTAVGVGAMRWSRVRRAQALSDIVTRVGDVEDSAAVGVGNGTASVRRELRAPIDSDRYFWFRERSFVARRHAAAKEKDTVLLCGAVHYFRLPVAAWRDRLRKLRAAGLNCVETYVPWNVHEPQPGAYSFLGQRDVELFLELAANESLLAVVRPGPYICAEWSGGGLPSWLLADPHMVLRSTYVPFMQAVADWWAQLMPRLQRHLFHRGGNVVMLQIENEYGNYGYDHHYMRMLRDILVELEIDCLLSTADGAHVDSQQAGGVEGALRTVTLRKNAERGFRELRTVQRWGPQFASEVWVGWFDSWLNAAHYVRPVADVVQVVGEILNKGASFNLYMFAGGSNGVRNGALVDADVFRPHTSTYDYDAPISEAGDLTPKFFVIRDAIARVYPDVVLPMPDDLGNASIAVPAALVALQTASLLTWAMQQRHLERNDTRVAAGTTTVMLGGEHFAVRPLMFEAAELAVDSGFVLYRTVLSIETARARISVAGLRDRAFVLLDGQLVGVLTRADMGQRGDNAVFVDVPAQGAVVLEVLVECLGRVSYGTALHDRKGIAEHVQVGRHHIVHGWKHVPVPLDDFPQPSSLEPLWRARSESARRQTEPSFYLFELYASSDAHGMYLLLSGWQTGYVWFNGKLLGRYWSAGPQQTIFIANSLVRVGGNEIVVLELISAPSNASVSFVGAPELGRPTVLPEWN